MNYIRQYLAESAAIAAQLDVHDIEGIVHHLAKAKQCNGRVFVLGIGGSAAAASHFVNDLRKLAAIDAHAPTDNVSELTARINDEGWESCFENWLKASHLGKNDVVFVFSVGGGDQERHISPNLIRALQYAMTIKATILGIVGRDGGYTAKVADARVIVPVINQDRITPHTESFHAVIAHLIVSHPRLQSATAKWESEMQTAR